MKKRVVNSSRTFATPILPYIATDSFVHEKQWIPSEFMAYLRYCRRLRFEQKPDYDHLRCMFMGLFMELCFYESWVPDWAASEANWTDDLGDIESRVSWSWTAPRSDVPNASEEDDPTW
mmetsp:Transcript_50071/g.81146  ORF Transcript_50071/g.81146 Transcript_50071/m.81146 type:complete len:119 (+) Transcript_50071:805-1161(+)